MRREVIRARPRHAIVALSAQGATCIAIHDRLMPDEPRRDGARANELAKLVALWPRDLDDRTIAGRLRLLAKLRSALREERQRGIAGHWTYDLARHGQLLAAYREESATLVALMRGRASHQPPG